MIEVNLLPGGRKRKSRGAKISLSSFSLPSLKGGKLPADPWILGAVAAGVVALAFVGYLRLSLGGQQEELDVALEEARQDSIRFADLIERTNALTARRDSIAQKVGIIQEIDQDRYVWPHILDEVARALPDYTWLQGMTQVAVGEQTEFRITGQAGNIFALTVFMEALEASPFLQGVRLISSEQAVMNQPERQVVVDFQLELAYVHPPLELLETVPLFDTETAQPADTTGA